MKMTKLNRRLHANTSMIALRRTMTPSEIRMGRIMRNPEGEHGGADGNNGGGDSNQQQQQSGNQNNNGQDTSIKGFWDDPSAKSDSSSNGNGGNSADGNGNDGGSQKPLGERLKESIQGTKFESVMTDAILSEIADGKVDGFNAAIDKVGQNVLTQSLNMSMQVMQAFGEKMLSIMEEKMSSTLSNRDNSDFLTKEIPSAADPEMGPMIRNVFDQAMKLNKGDKQASIKQTKEMLAVFAKGTVKDLKLDIPPVDTESRPTTNWIEALMSPGSN